MVSHGCALQLYCLRSNIELQVHPHRVSNNACHVERQLCHADGVSDG